jgi:uncharacterized glyoxalase superfamily protein PhnB
MSHRLTGFRSTEENQSMPGATVIPVLHYPDVLAAAAWLVRAFGFAERLRIGSHRIQLSIGEGAVVLAVGPVQLPPHPFSILVRLGDVDSHAQVAAAAGAHLLSHPETFPYGERQYSAEDLAGHIWTFSQSVANVDPATWGGELVSKPLSRAS